MWSCSSSAAIRRTRSASSCGRPLGGDVDQHPLAHAGSRHDLGVVHPHRGAGGGDQPVLAAELAAGRDRPGVLAGDAITILGVDVLAPSLRADPHLRPVARDSLEPGADVADTSGSLVDPVAHDRKIVRTRFPHEIQQRRDHGPSCTKGAPTDLNPESTVAELSAGFGSPVWSNRECSCTGESGRLDATGTGPAEGVSAGLERGPGGVHVVHQQHRWAAPGRSPGRTRVRSPGGSADRDLAGGAWRPRWHSNSLTGSDQRRPSSTASSCGG